MTDYDVTKLYNDYGDGYEFDGYMVTPIEDGYSGDPYIMPEWRLAWLEKAEEKTRLMSEYAETQRGVSEKDDARADRLSDLHDSYVRLQQAIEEAPDE